MSKQNRKNDLNILLIRPPSVFFRWGSLVKALCIRFFIRCVDFVEGVTAAQLVRSELSGQETISCVTFYGHCDPSDGSWQGSGATLLGPQQAHLLKDKIVYTVADYSVGELAREAKAGGALCYLGYNGELWLLKKGGEINPILRKKINKSLMIAANAGIRELIKQPVVSTASIVFAIKREYEDQIEFWERNVASSPSIFNDESWGCLFLRANYGLFQVL